MPGKVREEIAEVYADREGKLVKDTSTQQNRGDPGAREAREVSGKEED